MPDPIFQRSADARFLIQRLREVAIGETIEYAILAAAISKPLDALPAPMRTARRVLLKDESIVFDAVFGVGLKRLSDTEIVGTSASTARKLKRAARRGVDTLTAVKDFSALSREDQARHSASVSIFSTVAHMTTERSVTKIEAAVKDNMRALPVAQTLEAFKS